MNLSKINLGINDLKKERDHVKNLIIKTDERIDKLMRELRKTEPKTQESTPPILMYITSWNSNITLPVIV